jgi:hypothetical protein
MTPLERTLTALGQKEPDRVPLFLLTTLHGAKELNLSIKEYFSTSENVIKAQIRLQERECNKSKEILSITGITITENGVPGNGARFEMMAPKGVWRTSGKSA